MNMAASAQTLADLICEGVLPERYHPAHLRKSTGKTRPMGGGRTPLEVGKWQSFEDNVQTWWTERASRLLTQVNAAQTYPRVFPGHGVISKEDGVRAALQLCVFEPVNLALSQGLGLDFLLNETESIACVKSNVDWGGFLILRNQADMFTRLALPVEVKPPWQFRLSAGDGHVVDLLLSRDPVQRDKVRFSVAQIYLYMILEEAEFGVLCSKEQYIFLKRHGRPEDKMLLLSRTFQCEDETGVRKCLLYMCDCAQSSPTISKAAVEEAGPTPLAMKLVTPPGQKRKRRGSDRSRGKKKSSRLSASCVQARSADESTLLTGGSKPTELFERVVDDHEPLMLSAQASMEPTSWRRESGCGLDLVSWFKELAEFDIFSLKLGKVLSSAGKVIVREGSIGGVPAAIKMFDFIDGNELLEEFYNEIHAYEQLENLQGRAVPRILAYGSVWGHYMGFLALTLEGHELHIGSFRSQPHLVEEALKSLKLIHAASVLHGDIALRNMVLSATGEILFIDFGRCSIGVDEESCLEECEGLEELLHNSLGQPDVDQLQPVFLNTSYLAA